MDSEQKKAAVPVSNSISKSAKGSQVPNVSSDKSGTKSTVDAEKTNKAKLSGGKKHNRMDSIQPGTIKKLHDRTKKVRSKLVNIKKTIASMPKPDEADPTEDDILKEIERLQAKVKQMRLQSRMKTSRKDSEKERSISFQADNEDEDDKSEEVTGGSDERKEEKKSRRRLRKKNKNKKKKSLDENQLNLTQQNLFEKHINRIVSGVEDEGEQSKYPDLQFKLEDDLEMFAQKCVEAGLGIIVEGEVRVNAKNNHQAFITLPEGTDAIITSMAARKYAMDGDVVRAFVRNVSAPAIETLEEVADAVEAMKLETEVDDQSTDEAQVLKETEAIPFLKLTRQAFVICLTKETGNRVFVGSISFTNAIKLDEQEFFKFKPRDMKVPMLYIAVEQCDEVLTKQKSDDVLGFLYLAQITEIKDNGRCIGKLQSAVGKVGNLEDEIKAILLHNGLKNIQPFEERFEQMWDGPLTITEADLVNREDLRKECIFTIDPLTARDLDDAVSFKELENGCYEIGVHISDVTRFLEEASELDEIVKLRATSIYLVNEVIHMLPKSLCMTCSLLPNDDKFAFSVFWTMDAKAKVLSTRFARSIIRSCTQLAYEHAQKIIDNPKEAFTVDDFPTICNGFTVDDIVQRVHKLNCLAEIMRQDRFENGSLSIDKPQFYFQFDPKTGEPISYEIASRLTANFLIEEFMLLANQSVAQFIYKRFPDIAFLRNHQPPKPSAIRNLKAKLTAMGIELDMSSSKSIYDGIKSICGASSSPEVVSAGMNYLLTKPMMRAKYFCSENVDSEADLCHYALAIPIYTHFTSPIRRYPDVLVHRLLSAAMDLTPPPKRTPEQLHELAQICNDQKFNAKNAGEESSNLYFKRYVKSKRSINVRAVVTDIYRHSIEVITLETGHLVPINFKLQKVVVDASKAPTSIFISEKNSSTAPVELRMFSAVDVKLTIWEGKLTGFFVSPDYLQRRQNSRSNRRGKDDEPGSG